LPVIGDVIYGAVQQAPQPGRQWTGEDGEFTETAGEIVRCKDRGRTSCQYTTARACCS
jgi:hypothetical protein